MTVTVLSGATVITMDGARRVLADGAVAFTDSILAVGPTAEVLAGHPDADVVDCAGRVVLPGFVNTHTHLFQTLLKGLGDDRVLSDWFLAMTGPSAVQLTPEDCYAGALHGCAEASPRGRRPCSTSCTCTLGRASATRSRQRCRTPASAG